MIVETYRTGNLPSGTELGEGKLTSEEIRIGELQPLIRRLENQGLKVQAQMVREEVTALRTNARRESSLNPAHFYPQITNIEMKIWKVWLPTRYVENPKSSNELNFKEYAFDRIPEEVLQEIECARALNLFNTLEVRTPEIKAQDPILIGWFDKVPYLISRWGESLRPFEEIKQLVEEGRRIENKKILPLKLFNFLFVFGFIGVISTGFVLVKLQPQELEMESWSLGYTITFLLIFSVLLLIGGYIMIQLMEEKYNPAAFLNKHRLAVVQN